MTVFPNRRVWAIKQAIGRLTNRIVNSHKPTLTPNEMLEMYTKPEDREVLTRVFDLVQMESQTLRIKHPFKVPKGTVTLSAYIDLAPTDTKWLVPKYASQGPVRDANPELVAKLDKWVTRRIELGLECAMVGAVFDELNWRCRGGAMFKFFMPSILDVLDILAEHERWAKDMRETLSVARMPPLPTFTPELRGALLDVAGTVARARLMDKKAETETSAGVRFTISNPSKALGETPWGSSLTLV